MVSKHCIPLNFSYNHFCFSLLKETEQCNVDSNKETSDFTNSKSNISGVTVTPQLISHDKITLEDCQLLGRYGVWLLVSLCNPTKDMPDEILGRLLSMLFHWFHATAYSFDGRWIFIFCVHASNNP